jgi:hypothetical protein
VPALLQQRIIVSAPAQQAAEQEKNIQQPEETPKPTATATPSIHTSSISFSPDDIAAESSTSAGAAATLESYVVTEGEDRYVDLFWMDASERNGDIYLYGQVASPTEKLSREIVATSLSCHEKQRMNRSGVFMLSSRNPTVWNIIILLSICQ